MIDDIRQVSAYARLEKVYKKLGLENSNQLIDCLIIHPSLALEENKDLDFNKLETIEGYAKIYKQSLSIPLIIEH